MTKRILICKFHQESNTFNPVINDTQRFNAGDEFEGVRIFNKLMEENGTICGAVTAIREAGGEVIPTIFTHSGSGGPVSDGALAHFCQRLRHYLRNAGEYDAVYAELHGATCTETCDDACGEILAMIRQEVGQKPVAASCDLHAKITPKMLNNADMICGYQTYPHVDLYQTGYRAAKLCMARLAGQKGAWAASYVPMLVPPAGYTDKAGAFKGLMDKAKAMVADGTLIDFSIFVVQPWLDVNEISSCILTFAEDSAVAKEKAEELATGLYAIREEMWPDLRPVDEIIDAAEANTTGKPVILADSADSPNGGAVGDSVCVALRLQERGSKIKVAMSVRDAEAVEQAFCMGVGATGVFRVGGKMTPGLAGPFMAEGTVVGLYENDPLNGKHPKIGKTAVVRFGNIEMLLCTEGSSSRTPEMYRDFGIEPNDCDLIVIKANTSFRAFFAPVTDLIYVADTPGAGASNLRRLDWRMVPQTMYPFTESEDLQPESFLW